MSDRSGPCGLASSWFPGPWFVVGPLGLSLAPDLDRIRQNLAGEVRHSSPVASVCDGGISSRTDEVEERAKVGVVPHFVAISVKLCLSVDQGSPDSLSSLLSFFRRMSSVEVAPAKASVVGLEAYLKDAKVSVDWGTAFLEALGADLATDPEVVAGIPEEVIGPIVQTLERTGENNEKIKIRPVEMGALKLFIKKVRSGTIGSGGSVAAPPPPSASKVDETSAGRKRMADVLDQMDEGTFDPLTESERVTFHKNYVDITGGAPSLETKATNDQVAALRAKISAGKAPYADFAIFVPHGKRFAKLRKFDAQVFVNNTLQQRVMKGPSNFTSWTDSWSVFRTAMLSLQEASPQVLDDYQRGIRSLVQIHPDAWGLIFAADEIMRSEVWDEIRDELLLDGSWPTERPWNTVIKLSTFGSGDAKRNHWWYLHVQAPAQRGGKDLVKVLEGTTLLPSTDGMFGPTSTVSVSSNAAGPPATTAAVGKKSRPNMRQRHLKSGGASQKYDNADFSQASSSGWNPGPTGKGKGWQPKGKGKGDKNGQHSKGKKGGKTATK